MKTLCCFRTNVVERDKDFTIIDLENWMSQLPEGQRLLPLSFLAIPGSHNSFTYSLDKNSSIGPDEEKWLQDLAKTLGFVTKPIVYHWSVCQNLTCKQQLQFGVRYFDFRLGRDVKECRTKKAKEKLEHLYKMETDLNQIRILHGLFGSGVEDCLKDIKDFLDKHLNEVVILDFQHFYGLTGEDLLQLNDYVLHLFGSKICPVPVNPKMISLDFMNQHNHQVIIINNLSACQSKKFWPRGLCPNPWANTTSVSNLGNFLIQGLHKRNRNVLYVSQAILTPSSETVLLHLFSTLKSILVVKCNKFVVDKWLPELVTTHLRPNIILLDFITRTSCEAIVRLNHDIYL